MTRIVEPTPDPAQAAAEWVVRRDRGLTAAEASAFAAWRSAHADHALEFARIDASWRSLDRLAPAPVLSAAADVIVYRAQTRQSRRHRLSLLAGGLLATAAALAFAYIGWYRPAAPTDNFEIIASTSRDVLLPDGSRATLNGDSRIETEYTPGERRIRLVQGEAHFTVAKDSARPFYVTAGPITVRAVGTAFNVRLDASAVEVLVTEGKVRVNDSHRGISLLPATPAPDEPAGPSSVEGVLAAGQRVVVNLAAVVDLAAQSPRVAAVAPAEIEQALAWQSTRLVFNDTPLDEVVGAFNRYNEHQLVLGEQELAQRKITGVFRADNLEGFTRLLEAGVAVRAEPRSARETVLQPGH